MGGPNAGQRAGGGAAHPIVGDGAGAPPDDDPGDEHLEDGDAEALPPYTAAFGTQRRAEAREEDIPVGTPASPTAAEPLRERLRARRQYWDATMRQIGITCALTLSILTVGYRLEWDP